MRRGCCLTGQEASARCGQEPGRRGVAGGGVPGRERRSEQEDAQERKEDGSEQGRHYHISAEEGWAGQARQQSPAHCDLAHSVRKLL